MENVREAPSVGVKIVLNIGRATEKTAAGEMEHEGWREARGGLANVIHMKTSPGSVCGDIECRRVAELCSYLEIL